MKIFLISNSQGTDAGIERGENYPLLLRGALVPEHELHLMVMSGWSVRHFNDHLRNVLDVEPDVVVAQLGIIDAGRRILSNAEKAVLRRLGRLGGKIGAELHSRRKRVIIARNRLRIDARLLSPDEFAQELERLVEAIRASGARLILLEIPEFGEAHEREHYPLINEDIAIYNRILRRFGAVAPLPAGVDLDAIWLPGTVHLNELGHRLVAERIFALLGAGSAEGLVGDAVEIPAEPRSG